MRYIYGIVLGIILTLIFTKSIKRYRDMFSPMCIFALFQFVQYVPSMLFGTVEYGQTLNGITLFPTFIYELVFIAFVWFGFSLKRRKGSYSNENISTKELLDTKIYTKPKIFFLYCIGLAGKVYTVYTSGGISYIFNNTATAYLALTSGSGYLEILKYFSYVAIILMICRASKTSKKADVVVAFFMIITYMALDLIYSRRGTTITLIILVLFCVNYFNDRIKLRKFLKPKYFALVVFACAIIVILPYIRSTTFSSYDIKNTKFTFQQSMSDISSRLSVVGRDTFVYNYFGLDNYWLGRSYLNIFVSFIPSRLWSEKPAVDEGNYLKHLMNNVEVSPNSSVSSLIYKESIPFTTPGILYANFGIVGLIFGGAIMGYIYRVAYNRINKKSQSVFSYIIYRVVIFDFGLTVMLMTSSAVQYVICKLSGLLFRPKKRKILGSS